MGESVACAGVAARGCHRTTSGRDVELAERGHAGTMSAAAAVMLVGLAATAAVLAASDDRRISSSLGGGGGGGTGEVGTWSRDLSDDITGDCDEDDVRADGDDENADNGGGR